MRVLIDTNVLISAALYPDSIPYKAFSKAISSPNRGIVCYKNITEMIAVFERKFPHRISTLNKFVALLKDSMEIVEVPEGFGENEGAIRDADDRPIFRAAIAANAEVILTGDNDFLESGIQHPRAVKPSDFILEQQTSN